MIPATEIEIMKSLHTLFVKGLITWDQVEELLVASTQLEITYLNENRIESESLDGLIKYKIE
jgi:hypothetical protein